MEMRGFVSASIGVVLPAKRIAELAIACAAAEFSQCIDKTFSQRFPYHGHSSLSA
jgi:hypothetical protein